MHNLCQKASEIHFFCVIFQVESLDNVISEIKTSGNHFYGAKEYTKADRKYRKALRYIEW